MSALIEVVETRAVYALVVVLLGIGLYGMFARPNLIHKIVGLTVAQVAIFLFFIEGSVRKGATAPVIDPAIGSDPAAYVNPLPHLLILTAVVVGAATLGVALALAIRLHQAHGTLEEDALTAALDGRTAPGPANEDGKNPPDTADGTNHDDHDGPGGPGERPGDHHGPGEPGPGDRHSPGEPGGNRGDRR